MLITLVLLLSTGSLLSAESHQSSKSSSSSPSSSSSSPPSPSLNRQYHQSVSSSHQYAISTNNDGLGYGHPTAVARRNLQQQPSHYQQLKHSDSTSSPSSSFPAIHSSGSSDGGSKLIRRYWPNQSHSAQSSVQPSSSSVISSLLERRPTLLRGPRAGPGFLDVLESVSHEIRTLPGSEPHRPNSSPPPPPHQHKRQLGSRPSKPEMAITELKDISQIPNSILRAVKDRIQAMPGLKAFLLTKDGTTGPKIKPSILLTAPEEYSSKPGQLIWRLLNSKSAKGSTSFAKSLSSLTSRQRYPSTPSAGLVLSSPPPPPPPPQSSSSQSSEKYTFIEVPSAIDIDGTSSLESPFPSENIVINSSEQTDVTPEEILIESSENQMASSGNNVNNAIGNNHINNNANFNTLNGPIQPAESIVDAIEEIPRTYYYRDTTEPKGYHSGPGSLDYLQATSSIRDNSFAISPFTVNEHVPLSPVHNGWIPKNSKHWSPGAYRSAFYTPDTRLIKFTIHDRVSGSAKQSASPSIPIGTYVHPSLALRPVKSKNTNQFNRVNSNVNSRNSVNKYGANDHYNNPSSIEESYNINDDDLIKVTTTTVSSIITSTTTPAINKIPITVTLTPSSDSRSSIPPPPPAPAPSSSSLSTSQQDKSTESSTPITTIKPSLSSSS